MVPGETLHGANSAPQTYPGIAVSVLRKALDLMQVQGDTVVDMINSAPSPTGLDAEAPTDPAIGQLIDTFA